MAWKFFMAPPVVTQEELAFPLGLTSNADFRGQDPNGTYPIILMHEPQSLAALHTSLRAWGATPSDRKSPFMFGPWQAYPIGHHKRVFFVLCGSAYILFFYRNYCIYFNRPPALCLYQAWQTKSLSGYNGPV